MKPNRQQQIKKNIGGGKKKGGKHPGNTPLTAPLTTPQARHMAGAGARAEYGPTIRAAKQDVRGSRNRQHQIGEWFAGLNGQIQEAAQQTAANYGQANNALLAHARAAANAAAQTQGSIAQGNAATAALTGADPSLFQGIQAEGAAAANQRQIAQEALAAPIAQAGANQAAYLRNTGINATREGIQQRTGEMKRRDKIREDLTALRKERSQKAVGNFRDIRGEERDYGIQRKAFGLEKRGAALDAAEAAQNARDDAIKNAIAQQNANASTKNANTTARNSRGGKGGLTPSEKRGIREGRRNAMVTARNLYKAAKKKPQTASDWAAFAQLVAAEEEISPQEAQWAVNRLKKKVGGSSGVSADPNGASLGR